MFKLIHLMKKFKIINNKHNLIPFAEVFSKIISFINIILLMKVLLITEYADYSYIVAIVLWASVLMDGGINNLVFNKSLKNDLQDIDSLFSARFILSIFIIISLSIFFFYRKPDIAIAGVLYSVIIYISSSSSFIKMMARGKNYTKVDLTVILSEPLLRLFIFLMTLLLFQELEWHLWVIMVLYLIAGIFSFSLNYFILTKHIYLRIFFGNIKTVFNQLRVTLNASKFYLLYYLMYVGISRIDIIFIEKYASKTELALFSSAITLYSVIQLFFFSIITSHFKNIYKAQKKSFFYLLGVLSFVVVITVSISKFVFNILFRPEYIEGANILNFLIFAIIPSILVYYFITKLNFENKTFTNFLILLLPLILKIFVYNLVQSSEIDFYMSVYLFIEYFILMSFIIYFLFAKTSLFHKKM